jgi:hypothetical protein
MPTPWIKNVRDSHELKIVATQRVRDGSWNVVFKKAIVEFNRLSSSMGLGVRFREVGDLPDTSSVTANKGANVQFDAAAGTVHEVTLQNKFGQIIGQFTDEVDGKGLHGLTMPSVWQNDNGQKEQFRAYIYVPQGPEFNPGPPGKSKNREAGDGVKLFIAVHEMVHACGLGDGKDQEHSDGSTDPDLFIGQPQPVPGAIDKPEDDKLRIHLAPTLTLPKDPPNPPLFLSTRTANLIKSIWT